MNFKVLNETVKLCPYSLFVLQNPMRCMLDDAAESQSPMRYVLDAATESQRI
jgi:hypothetical protein